jgi:putative acetyltransferase
MNMPRIHLRHEDPQDAAAIEHVTREAFLKARRTLHTEQFTVAALRRAGRMKVSKVAIHEGKVIGHVAISPVRVSGSDLGWYGLGPVSVLPSYQGRGIGSALIMDALLELSTSGAAGCVVLGEPAYYERFGFKAHTGLTLPHAPASHFMAAAFNEIVPTGIVSYHEAFEAQG